MTIKHSIYREDVKVEIDEHGCTLCGQCVKICPAEVLGICCIKHWERL